MNSSKLMIFFAKGDKDWSDVSSSEQDSILSSFKEPENDIERSFFQYKCQQSFRANWKKIMFHVVSFVCFPFLIVVFLLVRILRKKEKQLDAVGSMIECKNVVPDSLKKEFQIDFDKWMNGFSLNVADILFIVKMIIKTPFAPYFVLKTAIKVAAYSDMIYRFQPRAFIVHDEYSFTSSLMTMYSNLHGVKQIDVMHGEKLFYIGDSFFRYDKCYVWDEYYKALLIKLRAEKHQFIIEQPKAVKLNITEALDPQKYAKYTYYLQIYDEDELQSIVKSLSFVELEGERVKFRPHPLYSDVNLLRKYVKASNIENPKEVTLEQSIANTDIVIGYYSTVLYQAYLAGKKVMLDNVTFKEGYMKLKEHDYIMSNCPNVNVLSEKQSN